MQLQNLYHRFRERSGTSTEVGGLTELLDDDFQDTEALIIQSPFGARPENHTGYIALVGDNPEPVLETGLLPHPGGQPESAADLRVINLPADSQRSVNVLLELEYADLVFFVLDAHERLSSRHLRWLMQIQILKVPIVLLVQGAEQLHKRIVERILANLQSRLNLPVVPIYTDRLNQTRTMLVQTIYEIAPKFAVLTSLQSPALRPLLVQRLLIDSAEQSLEVDANSATNQELSPLSRLQVRLAQKIKAIYGKGERLSVQEYQSVLTTANTATHYAHHLTSTLPTRDTMRRERVTNAVSTLILGYLTLVAHGEPPPNLRKQVVPQIWRLYRASGQMGSQ